MFKKTILLLAAWGVSAFGVGGEALSQTGKMHQSKGIHGQTEKTPYLTSAELRGISVQTKEANARNLSHAKSADFTLDALLSPSSLREVTEILGEPQSTDRDNFPEGGWAVTLKYEGGTMFDFRKYEDGTFALLEFQLWRSPWSLTVGGGTLHPGMPVDSLSPEVQQSIRKGTYPQGAEVDGIATIHIAKKNSAKSGSPTLVQDGKAEVTLHVDRKQRVVKVVRFSRLGTW